jgi:PAS domain S-box-containing protein
MLLGAVLVPLSVALLIRLGEHTGVWDRPFGISLHVVVTVATLGGLAVLVAEGLERGEDERVECAACEVAFVARDTERRLAVLTENATLGLFMIDVRQRCVFMNPAAEAITGFTLAEVQGKLLHEVIHHTKPDGSPYPLAECPIDRALPSRAREQGEDVFVRKDGSFYPVAFTVSPIIERGRPVGTVLEVRDMSAEKETERALREAVAARDQFMAIASHELRTPLSALSLQLELLRRFMATCKDPRAPRGLELALRQVGRLNTLVAALLDASRLVAGQLQLTIEHFDLRRLVEDTVEHLTELAERAGCEVRLAQGPAVLGSWDRGRLEQLVVNLLSNAFKYGASAPVDVELAEDDGWVELAVRDRGIGIPEDVQARIFGRFERAASLRNYGGLGLGLYIARRIVEAHGGGISVDSAPGQGARFRVRLPRVAGPIRTETRVAQRDAV